MKNKYKNITVPYHVYDEKEKYTCYYYKDKEYNKLNKLFSDFVEFELTYHFDENGKTKEVHNFNDVIESLLVNYKNFYIGRKYRDEYSDSEFEYITKLKEALLKNKLKIYYESRTPKQFGLFDFKHKKAYQEIYDKYKDVVVPKKVKSTVYNRKYFVVDGVMYDSVLFALDQVFNCSIYYEYGGSPRAGSNASRHQHDFDAVIIEVFRNFDEFKIYSYQKDCYSKQELYLLELITKKLKKMNYKPVKSHYDEDYMSEYNYLVNNRKFIKLFFFNIKDKIQTSRFNKKDLENHKIKED